jgi:Sulfotransferase family
VGVQRAGTTRWCKLITAHPEVVQALPQKELHYFDRFYAGDFTAADIATYHSYFPRRGEQQTGEWTPLYMSAPWIPPLLSRAAPQARLLVLLRDPVERYLSALELNAKVAARRGAPLSRYGPLEAFSRGFYHRQLVDLLRYFDRSQLLLLQYEHCNAEPRGELRRTYEFLGLSDVGFMPDLSAHPRAQPNKPSLDDDARAAYASAYSDDVAALIAAFPEIDVTLWPNFAHLAQQATARRPARA